MMYRICPHCGAALDPGERCDCREETESEPRTNHEQTPRKFAPTTTREYKRPPRCWNTETAKNRTTTT